MLAVLYTVWFRRRPEAGDTVDGDYTAYWASDNVLSTHDLA